MPGRILSLLYGIGAYAMGVGSLVYAVGFLANVGVPKGINDGAAVPPGTAVATNLLLLLLLPAQHTVMARPRFKAKWTQLIPPSIERSTFVLISGLLLWLLFWQWRPLPNVVWQSELPVVQVTVATIYLAGWAVVFSSSFLIDHFDLFGLRQVTLPLLGGEYTPPQFSARWYYRWVRHPLMAGFLVTFWAASTMTQGRLLFAVVITLYICVGVRLEERDLIAEHGESYAAYQRKTSMLLPWRQGHDGPQP